MRTKNNQTPKQRSSGYALLIVLSFVGISFLALTGTMTWSSNNSVTTDRRNQYYRTIAAAEAATEKIVSRMSADFQNQGEALVYQNLDVYRYMMPTTAENAYWSAFSFRDLANLATETSVSRVNPTTWVELQSQYSGLRGAAATYRIGSLASENSRRFNFQAGVRQEVQVATIPIFQFAIFYSVELEINPGPNMTVNGRVHSNTNLYMQPQATLNYLSDVTAVGTIIHDKHPNDPSVRTPGTITYQAEHDSGVSSLTLPIGTNNSPSAVYAILEPPPSGEDSRSPMGQQRYYNKADLVIEVTDSAVTTKSGAYNNFAVTVPTAQVAGFVTTNRTFVNAREGKTVKLVEIDVAAFKVWAEASNPLTASLDGRVASSIYVDDKRTQTSSTQPGVRLINGSVLPRDGLTVATPEPIYVKGHYNSPTSTRGTSSTVGTKPASLVGDAITVLSASFNDADGAATSAKYGLRAASSTTVNAAFLGGIVPTGWYSGVKKYSGGVENFPRFLENWSNDTMTYNGSMVVMFFSKVATVTWGGSYVYSPPSRNWAFDLNFLDPTKLPPGTPMVRSLIRGEWATVGAPPL